MELKFSKPMDDPEVLKRIAKDIRITDGFLDKLDMWLRVLVERALEEEKPDYNALLDEVLLSGKYDFYQAFIVVRALATNNKFPSYSEYPQFRTFVTETGKHARLINQTIMENR